MIPTSEAVAEALEGDPHGAPWAWAALRVLPTLSTEELPGYPDLPEDEFADTWPD